MKELAKGFNGLRLRHGWAAMDGFIAEIADDARLGVAVLAD